MKIMVCYVDGSWKPSHPNRVGGAAIIVNDNDTTEELMFYRDNKELAKIRNVAGELISAMEIVKIAVDRGYDKIQIFYDYEGIEKWYDSSWKCKNQYTKAYKEYMHNMNKYIDIEFVKVKGHSNDYFNELADYFAKKSLMLD